MKISSTVSIPDEELSFSFILSSGPGGQNVNKSETAIQLRFDVRNSPSLSAEIKKRLVILAGSHITKDGILFIKAKRYRSQEQNRTEATNRLRVLVERAVQRPKVRRSTKPSLSARIRRVETKKKRGAIKQQRQSIDE
jgi:ribosome-associated protein